LDLVSHKRYIATWNGASRVAEPKLDWKGGAIFTKDPDAAVIAKMLQIADCLESIVLGEKGEVYTTPTKFHIPEE
jgi:hypothetical protein